MKIDLDWPVKYWVALLKELEPLRKDSLLIDMLSEQIAPMTYTSEEHLFVELYEFQIKNGMNPSVLQSARQLQKYKGGAGLSKRIHQSERGSGIQDFKKRYQAFAGYLISKAEAVA
tara:strand:+ start:173 stop:520 length:348 start_codon:yes stop_codon:yes gene_type:complete